MQVQWEVGGNHQLRGQQGGRKRAPRGPGGPPGPLELAAPVGADADRELPAGGGGQGKDL